MLNLVRRYVALLYPAIFARGCLDCNEISESKIEILMRIHCCSDKLLSLEFLSGYITVRLPARSTACCYFEILIFNPSRVFADHLKLVADNLLFVIFLVVDLFVFWVSVLEFV